MVIIFMVLLLNKYSTCINSTNRPLLWLINCTVSFRKKSGQLNAGFCLVHYVFYTIFNLMKIELPLCRHRITGSSVCNEST